MQEEEIDEEIEVLLKKLLSQEELSLLKEIIKSRGEPQLKE